MTMVKLKIDDQEVEVKKGTTVLEAAKSIGVEIPHYCYHPGLSIAGNCRMCLVEVEKMPKPMIGCNTVVMDGMVVKTQSETVKEMRRSVMEFLLINHPLDCPTCDQAGECRLQDYYMQYDEIPSRFREQKIHKDKMINLGANVMLDCERCIACTRCIRVCQEVAGVDELALANRGDHVTITTFPGREMSNPYAGNVVDVCPVGALTSSDFRYKKRVWFLSKTPSVCPGCSRGCNMEIHHEDSRVYRLIPRENKEVNGYWMCDEGRYGYGFINEGRVFRARARQDNSWHEVSFEEAHAQLLSMIREIPLKRIAMVAHPFATNEVLKLWSDFGKNVLRTDLMFYSRHEVEDPFFDDKLVIADKNPNQAEINRLGFLPLNRVQETDGLLILYELSQKDLEWVHQRNMKVLALWASNESPVCEISNLVIPIPTYAEQDGHFTNVNGRVQKITKAFEPRGESRPINESLALLRQLIR